MFTGIIEEVGTLTKMVKQGEFAKLTIHAQKIIQDIKLGDSIAVNGICLTVTAFGQNYFCADVMSETLKRTALGALPPQSLVNLERAMPANGRFGGHIVSGHIDGTGQIMDIIPDNNATWLRIKTSPQIMRYIIEKGSITIDGISLTVVDRDEDSFQVSIIPHTLSHTNLGIKTKGATVNLENDIIGKYVAQLFSPNPSTTEVNRRTISTHFLTEVGF